jgi:molecular chaperone HscB
MNYFEYFELPVAFKLDESKLKKSYLQNSRKFHPDFYTLEDEDVQAEVLAKSSYNNTAYDVLRDTNQRMKYILDLQKVLGEEGSNKLDQDFLMEVMDINEAIMELNFDFDQVKHDEVVASTEMFKTELLKNVQQAMDDFDSGIDDQANLQLVKSYYLKNKYLSRILENIGKI